MGEGLDFTEDSNTLNPAPSPFRADRMSPYTWLRPRPVHHSDFPAWLCSVDSKSRVDNPPLNIRPTNPENSSATNTTAPSTFYTQFLAEQGGKLARLPRPTEIPEPGGGAERGGSPSSAGSPRRRTPREIAEV